MTEKNGNFVIEYLREEMPTISATEMIALQAGEPGIIAEYFSGKPGWDTVLGMERAKLTAEEKAFLDGPVEDLCEMLNDWEISQSKEQDMPEEAWEFAKENGFFGLEIPKEHGGMGFSELAHAKILEKLASRSFVGAIDIMVPNSLGPGKLIYKYGTDEQKETHLRNLAEGKEIPCFGLTEIKAGSDATAIEAEGIVFRDEASGEAKIRLNLDKRYITHAPIATLLGLAIKLKDPENILGRGVNPNTGDDPSITSVLVSSDTPGVETGNRHNPLGVPFPNGPIKIRNAEISVNDIIGGPEQAGNGWKMVVESLTVGRAISLPSASIGGMKFISRATGAYAKIREQFGWPVGKFKGLEGPLAKIAGLTYLSTAASDFTMDAIVTEGLKPSIISAMMKYQLTENMREVVKQAMDIEAGKGIMEGPRNHLAGLHKAAPIPITVEGANPMSIYLIIGGQSVLQAHPNTFKQQDAIHKGELGTFVKELTKQFGNIAKSELKSVVGSGGNPLDHKPTKGYYKKINNLITAFNVAENIGILHLRGEFKREERLSGATAEVIMNVYMAQAALRKFEKDGRPEGDLPLVKWSCEHSLHKAEEALEEFVENYPNKALKLAMKTNLLLDGKRAKKPSHALEHDVAQIILSPSETRDRLTEGTFISKDPNDYITQLEDTFEKVCEADRITRRIKDAAKEAKWRGGPPELLEQAVSSGVITEEEKAAIAEAKRAQFSVNTVNTFRNGELTR